jgi:hypothetical protein
VKALRPRLALAVLAGFLALGAAQIGSSELAAGSPDSSGDACLGAAAMDPTRQCERTAELPAVPPLDAAWADFGTVYDHNCVTLIPWEPEGYRTCEYFAGEGKPRIAVVGNSHTVQYMPAFLILARENNWAITTYLANKCFPNMVKIGLSRPKRDKCFAWGQWVLEQTARGHHDLIVTSNREGPPPVGVPHPKSYPVWKKGFADYLDVWLDRGERVLVLRDNPYPGHTLTSVPDCLAAHDRDVDACSAPRSAWLKPDPLADAALAAKSPRAQVADLTNLFCTEVCLPIIGNLEVYQDESHLTKSYVRTMAPYLAPYVRQALAAGGGTGQ